jgi:hypothetical protein
MKKIHEKIDRLFEYCTTLESSYVDPLLNLELDDWMTGFQKGNMVAELAVQ